GLPHIDSEPPAIAELDEPFAYLPAGTGDAPTWWRLVDGPPRARMDPATGAIAWTPTSPGRHALTIRLENEAGVDEQSFEVEVQPSADGSATGETGSTTHTGEPDDVGSSTSAAEPTTDASSSDDASSTTDGGCG